MDKQTREIFGIPAGVFIGKHLSYTEEMEGGLGGDVRYDSQPLESVCIIRPNVKLTL